LELIIQQGLQSPACLQQLEGDVHDWTPLLEGCWIPNSSKKKHVLTSIGKFKMTEGKEKYFFHLALDQESFF
jgi:hypothetical protein